MYQIDFNNPIHIHFIGIGGISMSGLAELLSTKGFTISGSDARESAITRHLESLGMQVHYGQVAENIQPGIDLIVYTAAILPDNPEFAASVASGIPMMDRASLLGQIMGHYANAIAVSGTHGKTTTTSMLAYVYLAADLDPTIAVGGILPGIQGNIRIGNSEHFIMEACEYTNSFHRFQPTTAIVLNVEEDHMDFFHDLKEIRDSFSHFLGLLPEDGLLVINGEIEDHKELYSHLPVRAVTYGIEGGSFDYMAEDIRFDDRGRGSYNLLVHGTSMGRIQLGVPGIHNVSNSLSVAAAALERNIPFSVLASALESYSGTDRRFQTKGVREGVTIIDDYAHHPTEIRATLTAASRCTHNQIWCVFQPHTYSRTKAFLDEFAEVLTLADKVVLTDIYAAREPDPGDISSMDILRKLEEKGQEVYYFKEFKEIENFLINNCTHGDLLITMGAGDVVNIGENLLQR